MKVKLSVISGPHKGKEFEFDRHDTFLVGRTPDAHLQLSEPDPHASRRHCLIEVNPPRCRLINLSTRNGTLLNGVRVDSAEVADGDEIEAGHTVFKVRVMPPDPDQLETLDLWVGRKSLDPTSDYQPPGIAIPGYRLEAELGRGAMGVVYRAKHNRDGAAVAIKTIAPAPGVNRKQIERFLRESRTLLQLTHDNIVAVQEVGEAGGVIYLVTDLVDGPNLDERLGERGPEDIRTGVRIICQALSGLVNAHANGFVHRDIKPSNILICGSTTKRTARLADVGLWRVFDTSPILGLKMLGEMGTPAYLAPEQVTQFQDVKPAADQYAAAATLYRLLTGRYIRDLPTDASAQLAAIVALEPIPITDRRPDIPVMLATVIHTALRRDPAERFPDVLSFRRALKLFA